MDLKTDGDSGPIVDNAAKSEDESLDSAIAKALQAGGTDDAATSDSSADTKPGTDTEEQADIATGGDDDGPEATASDADDKPSDGQAEDEAPKHWPEEHRKAFQKLPEEGRGIVRKLAKDLQGGYTRKMQEVGGYVNFAESVIDLFDDDLRSQIQRAGTNEVGFINHLVTLHRAAERDPKAFVDWFVSQNPAAFAQQQPTAGETQQRGPNDDLADLLVDPEVKQLRQQVGELSAWRDQQLRERQQWAQNQHHQHITSIHQAIDQFRGAQTDDGTLMFPHFEQVQRAMGALMETHPRLAGLPDSFQKMQAAYEMAVRADPELSRPLIDSEVTRRMDEQRRKDEAAKARRASGPRPSNGAVSARPAVGGLDDAIALAMRQHGAA